jgi:hypothetical protein
MRIRAADNACRLLGFIAGRLSYQLVAVTVIIAGNRAVSIKLSEFVRYPAYCILSKIGPVVNPTL